MFIVDDNPRFTHSVTAMAPIDGGFEPQEFKVTYRVMDAAEFEKLDLNTREGSDAFLRKVVVGLDDIAGADRKALPYSDQLRDKVIRLPWARKAIVQGYFKAIAKSVEGN